MKVAIIAPTTIPARRANTVQVMKMAQALAAHGHEIRLASPLSDDRSPGPRPDWAALAHHYGLEHRFPVEWLPASRGGRRYDYGYHAIRWAQRWGAELCYTRLPQAAALGSLIGLPTVLEVHDMPAGRIGPAMFRLFLRGRGARRLVVISQALLQDLVAHFGAPDSPLFTLVAPDGVDLARYENLLPPEPARQALQRTGALPATLQIRQFMAGYSGHLYPGRGVELLLALAGRLPDITFLLAGGEPQDVSRLQQEAAAKHLQNIILTGFIPNAELPGYQAACDLLLMPYGRRVAASSGGDIARYLSPMKLFEYLACGRPILSSDLPVLREVLTPQNALLLPPDDIVAWTSGLLALQADPERRSCLAAAARQTAARFSWEQRAAAIMEGL